MSTSGRLGTEITIKRLSPALGAEIRGVDLAKPIDDATFEMLHAAFLEHCVLVFRDQRLRPGDHVAFSERWGPPQEVGFGELEGYPTLSNLNYDDLDKTVTAVWHSDMMSWECPPMASILYAVQLPSLGGDTYFANAYLAYEGLSSGMKSLLEGVRALNHLELDAVRRMNVEPDMLPKAVHPVVRTHPETGRKSLYVCDSYTRSIHDMTVDESATLLKYLAAQIPKPAYTYRHRWQLGDVLMWDNRCTQHYAVNDYDEPRAMYRSTVAGDRPV